MSFILSNLATIVICAVLLAAIVAVIRRMVRTRGKGPGCACGVGTCDACSRVRSNSCGACAGCRAAMESVVENDKKQRKKR